MISSNLCLIRRTIFLPSSLRENQSLNFYIFLCVWFYSKQTNSSQDNLSFDLGNSSFGLFLHFGCFLQPTWWRNNDNLTVLTIWQSDNFLRITINHPNLAISNSHHDNISIWYSRLTKSQNNNLVGKYLNLKIWQYLNLPISSDNISNLGSHIISNWQSHNISIKQSHLHPCCRPSQGPQPPHWTLGFWAIKGYIYVCLCLMKAKAWKWHY